MECESGQITDEKRSELLSMSRTIESNGTLLQCTEAAITSNGTGTLSLSELAGAVELNESPLSTISTSDHLQTDNTDMTGPITLSELAGVVDDSNYQAIRRHFLKEGKGRPPTLPTVQLQNKLLIQLYFIKEERNGSYNELKMWLEKLVPETSAVTVGRIKHRITSLLETVSSGSRDQCTRLLTQQYDIHALAEPLQALGLTRLHLEDVNEFTGTPKDNISCEIVIALENFRSLRKAPSTFVNKWISRLCTPCQNFSQKQLTNKVSKLIKQHKNLSKRNDSVGKKVLNESLFFENSVGAKPLVQCNGCVDLKDSVKSRDNLIKMLEDKNAKSEINLAELQSTTCILKDEIASNFNCKVEKLQVVEENRALKRKSKVLEDELADIQKSRTYKTNHKLKRDNRALVNKVEDLHSELNQLKDKTSHTNLVNLKRQLKNEQSQKCKWKTKYAKLQDSLVHVNESFPSDELPASEINLRDSKYNKFSADVRLTYMALAGEADIPASKCSQVVDIVSTHLHKKQLKGLPCTSSVLNMADEGHHIAKQHIADKLTACGHFIFASDGTSRQKKHFMERHVILDDGTTLSLGFTEIASDDAKSMLEQAVDILEEIVDSKLDDDETCKDEIFIEILKRMKALMSDRAANMKKFDKLFYELKEEKLGPDDASTLFLYCNAHFLLGLSSGTENVLRGLEEEVSLPGTQFGIPNLFFGQLASLGLIRCAADVFGPRGDDKNGCREEWLAYCSQKNVISKFDSYRDNRFNNIFENASALIFHRNHIADFLDNYCSNSNRKLTSIRTAMDITDLITTILAVSTLNEVFTRPYWELMNSSTPYSEFAQYVQKMHQFLQFCTTASGHILNDLQPVFMDFGNHCSLNFIKCHLMNEHYDKELFAKTISTLTLKMLEVLERQLGEFLGDGIFAGVIPPQQKVILDKCPLTNLTGERLFGDFDYDISKRRHSSTHHRSFINMWKHNGIMKWLKNKSTSDQQRILKKAQSRSKLLRKEHREAVEREKEKIQKKIEENAQKKNQKEILDLAQRNKVLDSILKNGYCDTTEALQCLAMNGNVEDLKNQIRYRKIFRNQKDLKLTGSKSDLVQILYDCISSSSCSAGV